MSLKIFRLQLVVLDQGDIVWIQFDQNPTIGLVLFIRANRTKSSYLQKIRWKSHEKCQDMAEAIIILNRLLGIRAHKVIARPC